mgnify:CR=1 FL=1
MNSFMSWVGGKKSLRDAVLARFPPYYERYIEVFGGAGWILFHKPSGNDFEVYNDFNRRDKSFGSMQSSGIQPIK